MSGDHLSVAMTNTPARTLHILDVRETGKRYLFASSQFSLAYDSASDGDFRGVSRWRLRWRLSGTTGCRYGPTGVVNAVTGPRCQRCGCAGPIRITAKIFTTCPRWGSILLTGAVGSCGWPKIGSRFKEAELVLRTPAAAIGRIRYTRQNGAGNQRRLCASETKILSKIKRLGH